MRNAIEMVGKSGASEVYAWATHGVIHLPENDIPQKIQDMDCLKYLLISNSVAIANTDDGLCQYCDLLVSLYVNQNSTPFACDGFIVVTSTSSSFSPVSYLWSTGSNQNNIVGLCSGAYTLILTDTVGCTIDTTIIIGSQPIYGCTDPNAYNYDPTATVDDGTCMYSATCSTPSITGLS